MKVHIVYDSFFGNTKQVAEFIGEYFEKQKDEVVLYNVKQITLKVFKECDLLIVGSPTRAFKPTTAIMRFVKNIPQGDFKVTFYDTRLVEEDTSKGFLGFLVKLFGFAIDSMEKVGKKHHLDFALEPFWVYVQGTEGPIVDGELDRITTLLETIKK